MIKVEGFKAFKGVMKITPKNTNFKPQILTGDWLYRPDYNCWYGNGRSFMADICEIVEDFEERGDK